MNRDVVYSTRASQQLTDLYIWIAGQSSFADRAERYVSAIIDFCDALNAAPFVGNARDDLRPGLRTVGFRRRVVIAFAVTDEVVQVLGIYYGGQDFETDIDVHRM